MSFLGKKITPDFSGATFGFLYLVLAGAEFLAITFKISFRFARVCRSEVLIVSHEPVPFKARRSETVLVKIVSTLAGAGVAVAFLRVRVSSSVGVFFTNSA